MALGLSSTRGERPGPGNAGSSAASALIPDAFLDQLKERSSIVDVVGRRVQLRKTGTSMVGLCPFHKERSPSFTVSPARNTYHCFGCGAHGNALGFLIEHDGLPFRQAVRELAGEIGLPLPAEMQAGGKPAVDTGPMYQAMELAHRFFLHCLRESPEARSYLSSRGLEPRMLKRFHIGYAPAQWRGLREAFADYDRNATLVQVGLVREKSQDEEGKPEAVRTPDAGASGDPVQATPADVKPSGGLAALAALSALSDTDPQQPPQPARSRTNRYDTFRNRITFGVRDTRGRTIAFGARALGEEGPKDGPKYLNSPESPIFDKSGSLFGLFEARDAIRQHKWVFVVEGFMDVVMLAQHGVENAVAAMGTAFTRWHLERLLTQTSTIAFCFDGDAAGQKAAFKAMQTCAGLIEDEHDFRFVVLPDELDPDEFVRQRGAQAWQDLVQASPGWTEFMLTSLQKTCGIDPAKPALASAQARAQFAAQAVALAQRISYGQRLRKIVLEHIEAESRLPGTAIQALRRAPQKDALTRGRGLWELLLQSVRAAPAVALGVREEILELLEPQHPEERALAQALDQIDADTISTISTISTTCPGNDAVATAATAIAATPGYLMACDSLRSAVDLIVEHRQRQVREELDRQLAAGQITDLDYLRAKQQLMDEASAE
jgi:DNA primase